MPSFIEHLSHTTRSCRRFRGIYPVTKELMTKWVDNARLTASAGNKQPLRYRIVSDKEQCAEVFTTLSWAAQLPDWDGPVEGERPSGYIIMAVDSETFKGELWRFDAGIAAKGDYVIFGDIDMEDDTFYLVNLSKKSWKKIDIPKEFRKNMEMHIVNTQKKILVTNSKKAYLVDVSSL